MAKPKSHEEVIEAICDYKKGWTNLNSATRELERIDWALSRYRRRLAQRYETPQRHADPRVL